jgi:hypothetical protein
VRSAARAEWGGMSGSFADPEATCGKSRPTRLTITDDGSICI